MFNKQRALKKHQQNKGKKEEWEWKSKPFVYMFAFGMFIPLLTQFIRSSRGSPTNVDIVAVYILWDIFCCFGFFLTYSHYIAEKSKVIRPEITKSWIGVIGSAIVGIVASLIIATTIRVLLGIGVVMAFAFSLVFIYSYYAHHYRKKEGLKNIQE